MAGNWNSGRRPKSTKFKILRGITRRDRLNPNEPISPPGKVVKPAELSPGAIGVWDELAPVCLAMGTLTPADVCAFATLCELEVSLRLSRRWKADPEKLAEGLKLEKDTVTSIRPYYGLFGLEPVSRSRIKVPKTDEAPVSKWAGGLT